jgi:hypothetical protein
LSISSFRGGISGASNRRAAGNAATWRSFAGHWTLGASARAMSFSEDLDDGYFDPDFYLIAELPVQWLARRGSWSAEALLAPGAQKVGSDGGTSGTVRSTLALTHTLVPGREVGLIATWSSAGVNQLAAIDASDYRYFSIALRGSFAVPYAPAGAPSP